MASRFWIRAQPVLDGNVATDNGQVGIRFADSAGGEAIGNECMNNGLHGIAVTDQAQPTLKENICSDNAEMGIRYSGAAGGVASREQVRSQRPARHLAPG